MKESRPREGGAAADCGWITGDNEGLGRIRMEELKESCGALGIRDEHCVALDDP